MGITRLRNALTNHKHVIFSACVSYGKTVIMSFMAKGAVEKGNKVLIVSHRSELMTQTGGTLERVGIQAEYISPKHRNIPKGLVVSAMAQTLRRRIEKPEWVEWVKSVSLCLIDEGHTSDADFLFESGLLDDKYVVGLTGTPMRSGNQRQLGMNYEEIVETAQIQDMMDRGNITRLRTFTVDAPDLSKVNTDYRTGDFDSRQMGAVFNKSVQYKGVIENYMRICPMKKAICFDATQANAIRMCAEFNEAGIPAKFLISGIDKNKPDELELYEKYKHLTGNREQLIKDFHDDKFTVICNSGILSTGYDETSIEVCILNRATQSVQFYIQATGRAIRLHPNKTEAFLLDFGGNISRLGKFEKERKWALWHNKGKCEGIQGVKECKQCGKYIAITASECPFCGYVYPTEKEIRMAELQELVGDLKFEQMTPTQFFQYAELKGYNTYWAIRQLYIRNTETDFRKAMKECGYSSKFIWGYIQRNKK